MKGLITELMKLSSDIDKLSRKETFKKMDDPKFRSWSKSDLVSLYSKVKGNAEGKGKEQLIAGLYLWLNKLDKDTTVEY